MITILDCYTDEPAGLGVPPYLGVYPRYIVGSLDTLPYYITIDDLRLYKLYNSTILKTKPSKKTNIKIYNLTKNYKDIKNILKKTSILIVILGIHTPGKYLSALPGTLKEVISLIKDLKCQKILTGPAVYGTSLEGGKFFEKADLTIFDKIEEFDFSYDKIQEYSIKGSAIIKQIPSLRIIELETGHGCSGNCSFCTEPIKHKLEFREINDITNEIKAFYDLGCRYFRLGKQNCFYTYPKPVELLQKIKKNFPKIKVLHIDNVNPNMVVSKRGEQITKAIVKYCTPGNVAAFGIESFDKNVIKENNLNTTPENTFKAIKIINKYGKTRGNNGLQKFLPGINLLFGLKGESKTTHEQNMFYLKKIIKENLLLRRINIRQVNIFPGTDLYKTVGNKFLKKNKKYYWKWRNEIRQNIDFPMLKRLIPKGTILKDVRMEIYDGKTTFGRQLGSYPLIVGIKHRLELNKFYNIKITGHMLRSVIGEVL